jgi:hypothetical protein
MNNRSCECVSEAGAEKKGKSAVLCTQPPAGEHHTKKADDARQPNRLHLQRPYPNTHTSATRHPRLLTPLQQTLTFYVPHRVAFKELMRRSSPRLPFAPFLRDLPHFEQAGRKFYRDETAYIMYIIYLFAFPLALITWLFKAGKCPPSLGFLLSGPQTR